MLADRPFVALPNGRLCFVRHHGLETIDMLDADAGYRLVARFMGLKCRYDSKLVDQRINDSRIESLSIGVEIPPPNDSICGLSPYRNGVACLIHRNQEWYIELFSDDLNWMGIRKIPFPKTPHFWWSFAFCDEQWFFGDMNGSIVIFSDSELLPVDKEAYIQRLNEIDSKYFYPPIKQGAYRLPTLLDDSMKTIWKLPTISAPYGFGGATLGISARGDVLKAGEMVFSNAKYLYRSVPRPVLGRIRRMLRSLRFSPLLFKGRPQECKLTLFSDTAGMDDTLFTDRVRRNTRSVAGGGVEAGALTRGPLMT
jgi:hypothetical protein